MCKFKNHPPSLQISKVILLSPFVINYWVVFNTAEDPDCSTLNTCYHPNPRFHKLSASIRELCHIFPVKVPPLFVIPNCELLSTIIQPVNQLVQHSLQFTVIIAVRIALPHDWGALIGVCGETIGQKQNTSDLYLLLQELIFLLKGGNRPRQTAAPAETLNTPTIKKAKVVSMGSTHKRKALGRSRSVEFLSLV